MKKKFNLGLITQLNGRPMQKRARSKRVFLVNHKDTLTACAFLHLCFIFICLTGISVFSQNKIKNFDEFFSALAENQDFNGNILVAENGKVVYEKSFGYAD